MSQKYKIVETMRSDADEMEGWGAGNEAGRTRQAASLIQELGAALEEMVSFIDRANDYELVRAYRFKPYDDAKAILSKLKEA
jgi:hypothetical protein